MASRAVLASGERHKVLIVDDDPLIREILTEQLEQDYVVLSAGSVTEAEAILAAEDVQVVVSDHDMPGRKGLEFLSGLRKKDQNIQRILLTAHTERGMMLEAINGSQIFQYIEKGAGFDRVPSVVAQAVWKWEKESGAQRASEGLLKLEEEVASTPYVTARVKEFTRQVVHMFLVSFVSLLVLLVVGVVVLCSLYVLKSAFGIDVFSGLHAGDLF